MKANTTDNYKIWLNKCRRYCAYQERSQHEVRFKLKEWKVPASEIEQILAELITENFINEERFAITLAGGKFRIKKWGKIKIESALKKHQISTPCIRKALQSISNESYHTEIEKQIKKLYKSITNNSLTEKQKIIRSLINKGFEPELVRSKLNDLLEI